MTDPPTPPYPAATWIWFRCDVVTFLPVSYNWTGYCTSQGPRSVVFTYTNYNNTVGYTLNVRSTPTICIDTVVCSAVDSVGNSGEATWQIANVTGKNAKCKSAELAACWCKESDTDLFSHYSICWCPYNIVVFQHGLLLSQMSLEVATL